MDAGARGRIRKVRLGRGIEEDVKSDWGEEDVEEKEGLPRMILVDAD